MTDFAQARRNMVESQIRTNQVIDPPLIQALSDVPREEFVPHSKRSVAYVDEDLPLGDQRYLMEPMVFARLIQAAMVRREDVALDIGCATGYSAAVLSRLANTVVAVESDSALVKAANESVPAHGGDNVVVMARPLREGYPEQAPYDVIVLEGAVDEVPDGILDQLAEGGRLVAVVRDGRREHGPLSTGVGMATLVTRRAGGYGWLDLFNAAVPILPGFARPPAFVF